jgi:hypothetical protein
MTEVTTQPPNGGRHSKFTPETVRQIVTLVERGKSREEIAEIVGVTVGTLQVTCSKLGISLRRPTFAPGVLRRRAKAANSNHAVATFNHPRAVNGNGSLPLPPDAGEHDNAAQASSAVSHSQASPPHIRAGETAHGLSNQAVTAAANFAIEMRYKGEVRRTELPFDEDMIRKLALEAEFRDMRLGELLSELMLAVMRRDLLELALEPRTDRLASL